MNPTTTNTLLNYSLNTLPDPLQASPAQGNIVYGALSFVISNGGSEVVQLSQLQFTFPIGALAQELTANADAILWSTSPGNAWDVTMTSSGVFLLVPASGNPISVSTDGMMVQFYNIPINQQVGTVAVTISETASDTSEPQQARTAQFDVAKFPYGFYFSNLSAQVPMVQEGGTATLTWLGSDDATYTMLWGSSTQDVTDLRSWTSPALTSDTTFLLRAQVVSQNETVTSDLSTTVIVADPELNASTLQVTGTSNLQGATTIGGALDAAAVTATALSVSGAASAASLSAGSATLSGNLGAGSANISGAASSASLSTGSVIATGLSVGTGNPPGNTANISVPLTLGGTVNMMPALQFINSGITYTAPTDGMVVVSATSALINNNAGKRCLTWIWGVCSNGLQTWATVGNTQFYPGWACINNQSFCMPVSKGSAFSITTQNDSSNQINPTLLFSFVPFGSTTPVAALVAVGEAPPPPPIPGAVRVDSPLDHLVRALAEVVAETGSAARKDQLAGLLAQAFPAQDT
jgi:hypothetical protein